MDFPIPYFLPIYFFHSCACCNKGFFHDKPPLTSVRSSDFKVHATKQKRGLFFLEGLLPVITWKPGISAGHKVHLKSPVVDSFLKAGSEIYIGWFGPVGCLSS